MLRPRYELFDHTADLGVRVLAPSLPELVTHGTDGLYAVIGELATRGAPAARTFELRGDDPAMLLRDYLAELLYLFEYERRQLTDVEVREFTARRLVVTGQARAIDESESVLEREVKAITYHELAVRPVSGGYEATYIVDI